MSLFDLYLFVIEATSFGCLTYCFPSLYPLSFSKFVLLLWSFDRALQALSGRYLSFPPLFFPDSVLHFSFVHFLSLFDSDLFHWSDDVHFAEGYENRRMNITMLFGVRRGAT